MPEQVVEWGVALETRPGVDGVILRVRHWDKGRIECLRPHDSRKFPSREVAEKYALRAGILMSGQALSSSTTVIVRVDNRGR